MFRRAARHCFLSADDGGAPFTGSSIHGLEPPLHPVFSFRRSRVELLLQLTKAAEDVCNSLIDFQNSLHPRRFLRDRFADAPPKLRPSAGQPQRKRKRTELVFLPFQIGDRPPCRQYLVLKPLDERVYSGNVT